MNKEFTHFDHEGNARMVDVSEKADTHREAVAAGRIYMSPVCLSMVAAGQMKKGDVLGVARIAGIMGAKRTHDLIPLCHLLNITGVDLWFDLSPDRGEKEEHWIEAHCRVRTTGKTGVEMEALTGVQIALLTIYDMCKAVERGMIISDVHLVSKSGGKSGDYHA